jgi:hypothetical protein
VNEITRTLADARVVAPEDRGILITTDCLYPSRASVVILVVGGLRGETVTVHDDGGAAEELFIVGRTAARLRGILTRVARRYGLCVVGDVIASEPCPMEDVAAAIRLVANASQEAARELLGVSEPRAKRDLPQEIARAVTILHPDAQVLFEHAVTGASSRSHRFDVFVPLPGGQSLLVDTVSPDTSSVNAAIVANLDVGRRQDVRYLRAIVFDPLRQDAFDPGSLALLAEVASTTSIDDFGRWFERASQAA